MALRVVIVDDSILFRRVVVNALATMPGVEVVGQAANGRVALQRIKDLKPDLVTLDLEIPEMDGLKVLETLRRQGDSVRVIVVSALTRRGGAQTLRALELGAFDFITKPEGVDAATSQRLITEELGTRVRFLSHELEVRALLRHEPAPSAPQTPPRPLARAAPPPASSPTLPRSGTPVRPAIVLIGVSTGGPAALAELLPALPRGLGVPVLVVQHMPPLFTLSLAESLAQKCQLSVSEAVDGETPTLDHVYLAPGGRQMRLSQGANDTQRIRLTDDPPENNCRPAVDYLFRSAAQLVPGKALAVILTGMGQDGVAGLRQLKDHGCYVIAQDEATSVVFGMPRAAIEAGVVDAVLPLPQIAGRITLQVRGVGP